MTRRPVPQGIQDKVLILSRRRCCVCFGLTRDKSLKRGQIAHLDGNPENSNIENLAFLCLDHHDEYDSETSQSKSLTINEIKHYRDELYKAIESVWKEEIITFSEEPTDFFRRIEGHYFWERPNASAEIEVKYIGSRTLQIEGLALYGTDRDFGPNIGQLDFTGELVGQSLTFMGELGQHTYRATFVFANGRLRVDEDGAFGYFGVGAAFSGEYKKSRR